MVKNLDNKISKANNPKKLYNNTNNYQLQMNYNKYKYLQVDNFNYNRSIYC